MPSFWFPGVRNMNTIFSPENPTNQTPNSHSHPPPTPRLNQQNPFVLATWTQMNPSGPSWGPLEPLPIYSLKHAYCSFLLYVSYRRLCTLLGCDISSYKAKDMQWLEFLYYIEPITEASTERTKFGPLLWTKLKQQVLLTPLTQETLYYLSAFWWTRQLREVTGFSPSQEIFAVTFNHVCARKKKTTPLNTFPTEAECKLKNLSSIEWILQGGFFSYLPMFCLVTGDHLEKF